MHRTCFHLSTKGYCLARPSHRTLQTFNIGISMSTPHHPFRISPLVAPWMAMCNRPAAPLPAAALDAEGPPVQLLAGAGPEVLQCTVTIPPVSWTEQA